MGQFKPMVKMMTTEPSIELKLKKGGHVAMPKMKSKDNGTGSKKMATGGLTVPRCGVPDRTAITGGVAPSKPTMSQRRKAMMGRKMAEGGDALKKHAALPASKAHKGLKTGGVAMGQGGYKDGGSVIPVSASKKGAEKYDETLMHTAKPDHSPAKTGGVKNGNGGGYKKGGNVKMATGGPLPQALNKPTSMVPTKGPTRAPLAQSLNKPTSMLPPPTIPRRGSGPNDAGPMPSPRRSPVVQADKDRATRAEAMFGKKYAKGGGVEGNVSSTPPGVTNTTTGGVRKGNAGGFKKGGAPKKFARGGSVNDSGKAVAMPQGYKKPPTPVSINQLSGTYKKGGKVRKYAEGGMSDKEQTKAYDKFYADEKAENQADREAMLNALRNPVDALKSLPERLRKGYEELKKGLQGSGSVTTTEREVSRTVTPTKKRYGGAC
jgi:hypothetical protein